jgi:hypothetical protein
MSRQHVRDHLVPRDGLAHLHAPLRVARAARQAASAMPRPWMATAIRASFMKVRISLKPAPRGPSSSAQLPSKLSSQVAEPRMTIFFSGLGHAEVVAPVLDARDDEQGRGPRALRSRLGAGQHDGDVAAPVGDELLPARDAPVAPSGTAVVETLPTSDPASGSVMATEPEISPAASRGTQRSACSRVPEARDRHRRPLVEDVQQERVRAGAGEHLGHEGARGHREVGAAEIAREVHSMTPSFFSPSMLRSRAGRMD